MTFRLRLKNANFGGQSLIEVIVSIGVAVILAITCFTFTTPDLNVPSTWTLTSGCSTPQTISLGTTIFTRKVAMINEPLVTAEKRLITVTVSWDESGQTRSVKSQTFLSLWQDFP